MAMPQCCYLAKGAKRPSHTTNTIKFDRIPFDPCNSIKRFDLSPFDQKNSTYLQPPEPFDRIAGIEWNAIELYRICCMARSLPSLRQVATLRHGYMARRSASLRSCIQGTRGMYMNISDYVIRYVASH